MAANASPHSSLSVINNQDDMDSFLKVEDMNDELLIDLVTNTDTTVDGSGESKLSIRKSLRIRLSFS